MPGTAYTWPYRRLFKHRHIHIDARSSTLTVIKTDMHAVVHTHRQAANKYNCPPGTHTPSFGIFPPSFIEI